MKVLLISHTCQSRTEGQPRARELAKLDGLELTLLTPDRWKRYGDWRRADKPRDAQFRFVEGKILWPWSGPGQTYLHWHPSLPRLLKQLQPDIIDLWEEPWSLVAAQTCFWRDRVCPNAKIVAETEQNIDKKLPPPFENFRSYVLNRADYLVGRNVESIEILQRKGYAGPSSVVPNAVDVELFTRDSNRQHTRGERSWNGFVVGYAGRLVESKGVFDLLEAAKQLENVQLVFIGDGEARAELEKRATASVRFVGAQSLEQLPELFSALDCLVLPSRTTRSWKEQFGRVLIEAASCGVPVIGSDSGAIPDVIGQIGQGAKAMGLIFAEGDVAALSAALIRLQREPELARALGETGARRARAEFSWARVAARFDQIYREMSESERA